MPRAASSASPIAAGGIKSNFTNASTCLAVMLHRTRSSPSGLRYRERRILSANLSAPWAGRR
jgi:hypothetical protein